VFEERDEYQCNAALGFPRVALLFQSAGDMPHERLWRAWLGGVVGLIPLAPDGAQVQLLYRSRAMKGLCNGDQGVVSEQLIAMDAIDSGLFISQHPCKSELAICPPLHIIEETVLPAPAAARVRRGDPDVGEAGVPDPAHRHRHPAAAPVHGLRAPVEELRRCC